MPATIAAALDDIRASRREKFRELAGTPEAHLNRMTRWGYGPTEVRYMFLRYSDHEEEHGLQIEHTLRAMHGWQPTHVQLILGAAERTRGDLLASLTGLDDGDLDAIPDEPAGEWPLRQTLAHCIATELNYRVNTLHAVERFRNGEEHGESPSRQSPEEYTHLSFDEMLEALDAERNRTITELSVLSDADLPAPAIWSGITLDVNWRLMRFSHHEREHTAQIRKWRVQTGKHQTDAQRLLSLAWQSHGVLRGFLAGVPDELLERSPGNGEWSIRQALTHMRESEDFFHDMIPAGE